MTGTCPDRRPGERYCDVCPSRPVKPECEERPAPRSFREVVAGNSIVSRLGTFILCAFAITSLPSLLRTFVRTRVEGQLPEAIMTPLYVLTGTMAVLMLVASFYGLWYSVFGARKRK